MVCNYIVEEQYRSAAEGTRRSDVWLVCSYIVEEQHRGAAEGACRSNMWFVCYDLSL